MQIIRVLLLLAAFGCLSCFSIQAQEKATPKNGEGIESFLKRFDRNGASYRKEFIRINKAKLGKNNTLKLGVTYTLPPLQKEPTTSGSRNKSRKGYEPLFGQIGRAHV